jgi:hypothetical protein
VIVRASPDSAAADITPAGFNVRTRAHEYGGGSWLVAGGTWIFSNFADQRLYRQRAGQSDAEPLTPAPLSPMMPPSTMMTAATTTFREAAGECRMNLT